MELSDQVKAIRREYPGRIPLRVSILPSAWMKYREALDAIVARYPAVFGTPADRKDYDAVDGTYVAGDKTDAWGCVWSNIREGVGSIVTGHPAPAREDVRSLKIPDEDDGLPHGFMYLRLGDIRGFEEIMADFAEEPPELQMLIDKVLAYNLRQVRRKLAAVDKPGQILIFGDDLGMQQSLPISPEKWRRYLKPCYKQVYSPVKDAGHYVYMHTDGHILEIVPDLVECGVDVLNLQVGANGLENLARVCKGKVCVELDLDRQQFPFWGAEDIDAHVKESVEILGSPEGGLWLKAEIAHDVPIENIEAVFSALDKYSLYYSTTSDAPAAV